jgi:O-antigen/teichoic acid export membrane protein
MRRRAASMEERFLRGGAVEPEARRPPGGGRARVLAAGLARFAALVALAGGAALGLGLLLGRSRGSEPVDAAAWGLYGGGIALIGFALLGGGRQRRWRGEHGEDLGASPAAGPVYLAVGVALLGLGVLVETLFR